MSEELKLRCGKNLLAAIFAALEDAEDSISYILAERLEEALIGCRERDVDEATLFFSKDDNGNAQLLRLREIWKILHEEMDILDAGVRLNTDSLVKEERKDG